MNYEDEIRDKIISSKSLEESLSILEMLINKGHDIYIDGRLMIIKVLVSTVNGLKIEINHKEHAPPHFHLFGQGFDATFKIDDCTQLNGHIDARHDRLIKYWFRDSKRLLIDTWNKTRPSDCPVGPIIQ